MQSQIQDCTRYSGAHVHYTEGHDTFPMVFTTNIDDMCGLIHMYSPFIVIWTYSYVDMLTSSYHFYIVCVHVGGGSWHTCSFSQAPPEGRHQVHVWFVCRELGEVQGRSDQRSHPSSLYGTGKNTSGTRVCAGMGISMCVQRCVGWCPHTHTVRCTHPSSLSILYSSPVFSL